MPEVETLLIQGVEWSNRPLGYTCLEFIFLPKAGGIRTIVFLLHLYNIEWGFHHAEVEVGGREAVVSMAQVSPTFPQIIKIQYVFTKTVYYFALSPQENF